MYFSEKEENQMGANEREREREREKDSMIGLMN